MPVYGWIFLTIIVLTISFLVFFLAWKRGLNLKSGDKSVHIGNVVDEKISESRRLEMHDRDLQNYLYGESLHIDARCTAEMKRVIRNLDEEITGIFRQYEKCEFPALELYRMIQQELFQRIEDNNLREKFSMSEKRGYVDDIEYKIKNKYSNFLLRVNKTTCDENYPEWEEIQPKMHTMLLQWEDAEITILVSRISEKMNNYDSYKNEFKTDEYRESAINIPMKKNERYLSNLGMARTK